MNTEREYLYSIGLTKAPTGRGRFSREAVAAVVKARADGMTFKEKIVPAVKSKPRVETPKTIKVSTSVLEHESVPGAIQDGFGQAFLRYGRIDMSFEGVDSDGKRHVVSGRNACSCGYSLVGHICENATALVNGGDRISVSPVV